jgi:hypothetical protein
MPWQSSWKKLMWMRVDLAMNGELGDASNKPSSRPVGVVGF